MKIIILSLIIAALIESSYQRIKAKKINKVAQNGFIMEKNINFYNGNKDNNFEIQLNNKFNYLFIPTSLLNIKAVKNINLLSFSKENKCFSLGLVEDVILLVNNKKQTKERQYEVKYTPKDNCSISYNKDIETIKVCLKPEISKSTIKFKIENVEFNFSFSMDKASIEKQILNHNQEAKQLILSQKEAKVKEIFDNIQN